MGKIRLECGTDPTLPDVVINIAGKDRQLAYDFAAITRVEKLSGINLLNAAVDGGSFGDSAVLLYAALLKEDPKLKLEEVQTWITPLNVFVVQQAIRAAWFGSIPAGHGSDDEDDAGETAAQDQPEA